MADRAIIVGFNINNDANFLDSMDELENLCAACDIEAVGRLTQKGRFLNKNTCIGMGKVEELKSLIAELSAEVAVFNHELSGSQLRNLEDALGVEVIDRTALILHIFSTRARSREAKLQVEIARLQYSLPRLIGLNGKMDRQGGGAGFANKGGGEKKLELDKRHISERIVRLNRELDEVLLQRRTQNARREKAELPRVALVGYTNAGKSTVMNALLKLSSADEDKKVFEKDQLFATLDTSTRRINAPDYSEFLLSDTVGFVSNLPHQLVKAFRSTLQEVKDADLLLHIIDISNPDYLRQEQVTMDTLREIGADGIPMLKVYNKIDKLDGEGETGGIAISAAYGIGLDKLIAKICENIFAKRHICRFHIPYANGKDLAYFMDNTKVNAVEHTELGYRITVECTASVLTAYRKYLDIE